MTRRHLRVVVLAVIAIYAIGIATGIVLRMPFGKDENNYYKAYKDIVPLMIAIPAAYLAFAFQQRNSYLKALRAVWSRMTAAISASLVYTDAASPTEDLYLEALGKLSIAIEEVRGVFTNVRAAESADGWYPFEPVRQIYQEIRRLGFGSDATPEKRTAARDRIYAMWKSSREQLLAEFDRDAPTHHHAEYAVAEPKGGATVP